MYTDPIADLLTRIRNSVNAKQDYCDIPHSKIKEEVVRLFVREGYLASSEVVVLSGFKVIRCINKYIGKNRNVVVNSIKRVSKPGCRRYAAYRDLKPVLGGLGMAVVTTPQGVLSDSEARSLKVGGEVLCEIW